MKLTCDACKLTLNARDEDRGKTFTCPICRGPLHEVGAAPAADKAGGDGAAAQPRRPATPSLEWGGGSLDDLLYMVNSQALAAVIEINAPDKKGEVHVIAGGIDEAFHNDQKGDDALVSLRKYDSSRFRVELRLPSDAGNLLSPNPDRGDLKGKPLAKLMRYCEEYVLTCDLEAWRGTETARVEYRRGNIARTLINGIDAPEQLGEVMAWTSGNFRFVLPRLALPTELDQASRMQAKAAAETRIAEQKAARKTMFGMPAAQMFPGGIPGAQKPASAPPQAAAPPPPQPPPPQPGSKTMFMGSPASSQPQVQAAAAAPGPQAPAKTMLGMPVMAPTAALSGSAPAGGPSSVVIDSAYAAASTPAKAPEAAPPGQDMHVTARGYQPVATANPSGQQQQQQQQIHKAKTEPPQSRETKPTAEPEKPKEKTTSKVPKQQASARKGTPAPEKVASPWMNVGIAVGVAAVIVVVWLLVSFFSK